MHHCFKNLASLISTEMNACH
uniref:Uncharacterized protein n=1 Tax=Anguilla anguilla TaxID=7936 RepID=A0A0E9PHA5_ANGAN